MRTNLKAMIIFTAILAIVLLSMTSSVKAQSRRTVADLINNAHKHDNMYVSGPQVSQQKALGFYESALAVKPDDNQRLHILYRMAQLNGSAYQLTKGEKPDFRKAIKLYEEIISICPPEDPLAHKAMRSISDHYTSLREFEDALAWSKKALEYDTDMIADQIEATAKKILPYELDPTESGATPLTKQERLEIKRQVRQVRALKKDLDKIKGFQKVSVDNVAYCADLIDPLRAHGELRDIIKNHAGTFIAERAAEHLAENMDKMLDLWAPQQDELFESNGSILELIPASPGTF